MSTVADKFQSLDVPVTLIDLPGGSCLPGGKDAVSWGVLASLVKGTREPVLVRPAGDRYEACCRRSGILDCPGQG